MIHLIWLCFLIQDIVTSDECGITNFDPSSFQFAINGDNSDVKAPWMAALGIMRNDTEGDLKFAVTCSGVILTPNVIITAAHCFFDGLNPEYIRAGVTRIDQANPQDRKIREYKSHPDRNNKDWYYDLALVFVTEPLNFNGKVSSLCLPKKPYPHPGDGLGVLVQGWGGDQFGENGMELTQVKVNVRSKGECDYRFSQTGPENKDAVQKFLPTLTSSELFCADSSLDSQAGTCQEWPSLAIM